MLMRYLILCGGGRECRIELELFLSASRGHFQGSVIYETNNLHAFKRQASKLQLIRTIRFKYLLAVSLDLVSRHGTTTRVYPDAPHSLLLDSQREP